MKRHFLYWMVIVLASAGMAFVSCEKPDEPKDDPGKTEEPVDKPVQKDPVFPDAVTEALEASGSYTLELQPNVDWKIELKYDKESAGWFWIQDSNSVVYSLQGKAEEKVSVKVCAGEQTDFDDIHSCTLEMTMGGETKTIATFTRGTVERTFTLAYCKIEEAGGDYVYNETDGSGLQYEYNEVLAGTSPMIPLAWLGRTGDFRRSILITANFDWQMKSKPEWMLDLRVTGGDAGMQVELELEGDPLLYPLEDATAELVFCPKDNRDVTYAYTVKIPGCGNLFSISGFEAETKANAAGEMFKKSLMEGEGSWFPADLGITGSVFGLDGVRIYTFAYAQPDPFSGKMWDSSAENIGWLSASLEPWSNENGVVQSRNLNITVKENTSEEREAYVFAIPAAECPEVDYMIFPDGQKMAEKYSKYIVTHIIQEGVAAPDPDPNPEPEPEPEPEVQPITFQMTTNYNYKIPADQATLVQVTSDNMETLAAGYKEKYGFNLSDFCTTSATYVLTYFPDVQQSMTALDIPDFSGNTLQTICTPENGKEWLSYEVSEDTISIWMKKPEADASQKFGVIQLYISMARSYTIICLPEL